MLLKNFFFGIAFFAPPWYNLCINHAKEGSAMPETTLSYTDKRDFTLTEINELFSTVDWAVSRRTKRIRWNKCPSARFFAERLTPCILRRSFLFTPVFVYREIFDDLIHIGIGIAFQAVIDVVFGAGRPFGGNGISSRKILSGSIDFCRSFAYNNIGVKVFKGVGQLEPGGFENFLTPFLFQ